MHTSGWAHTVGRHMYAHSTHRQTSIHVGGRKETGGRRGLKGAGGQAKCKNNGIHERKSRNKIVTHMYSNVLMGPGRQLSKEMCLP